MGGKGLEQSRGKPTIAELYHLATDVSESNNLAEQKLETVNRMTADFQRLIDQGTSRAGLRMKNDTDVQFRTTQTQRWSPPIDK